MLIVKMSDELKLPQKYLINTISSSNNRYKEFHILKRDGSQRLIQHPARRLKILQRWLAYREGSSIQKNALQHLGQKYLLKADFRDFFSSIKACDVEEVLIANSLAFAGVASTEDIATISKIVCRRGELVIGAPSSPIVSNVVMFELDRKISSVCQSLGVNYTRYADDLTFSCSRENVLFNVLEFIRRSVRDASSPRLTINEDKVHHASRKRRMRVTGLVLTTDSVISVGRQNKRFLRSLIHKHLAGALPPERSEYLLGYLSFVKGVEPSLLARLQSKYRFSLENGRLLPQHLQDDSSGAVTGGAV